MIGYLRVWLTLWLDDRAVTALEYGIIGGVIVALIAIGFASFATSLSTKMVRTGQGL
jgi:Flp pilus assembly pilin Flp